MISPFFASWQLDAWLFGHNDLLNSFNTFSIDSAAAAADRYFDLPLRSEDSAIAGLGDNDDVLRCGKADAGGGFSSAPTSA
jgi:hypothetical protein